MDKLLALYPGVPSSITGSSSPVDETLNHDPMTLAVGGMLNTNPLIAQSVTCLTADPGVASSIPARYHTFVEIDHEIISTVILLPSADLFKKGCCQLQAKVCA